MKASGKNRNLKFSCKVRGCELSFTIQEQDPAVIVIPTVCQALKQYFTLLSFFLTASIIIGVIALFIGEKTERLEGLALEGFRFESSVYV